jgi:phenylalanyl-tRNA synthetase beta chain
VRVPLSWLAEYVDLPWPPDELAARLTELGMQVSSIERIGSDWRGVVVGELLDVRRHPNSDRLSMTAVTVGPGSAPLEIVCGATNIVAGQRVPVALPGSVLPGGRRIEVTRIAGADSAGMLCSPAELDLTPDGDGILILEGAPALGTPLEDLLAETVLDIDVKPNRGDVLSLIGLAREVAAISGQPVRWPQISVPETGDGTADHLTVRVEAADLCSRFVGRYVDGLAVGPSPTGIQLRLHAAGLRPVSNVVDASNYVMLELGKPIHTFDASSIADGQLVVRRARPGERLVTLDHVERELDGDDLLIADGRGPLGIAGVMGGANSEVGTGTAAVVIESAIFDPVAIRRTAHRHALRSEASQRFERGQEFRLARLGADRTAQLLAAWAGGRPAQGVVDTNPVEPPTRRVAFRPNRINRLLGSSLDAERMSELLERAEITVEQVRAEDRVPVIAGSEPTEVDPTSDARAAVVPSHRRDIEIEADLAEEIARLHGYQSLPASLPASQTPPYRPHPDRSVHQLRELLSARGLAETLSHVLVGAADHARMGINAADPATIGVANPITADHSQLRRSLLPGLMSALVVNERQRRPDVAIFEVGPVHAYDAHEAGQRDMLGILLAGTWEAADWAGPAREAGLHLLKGVIEWAALRLGAGQVSYRRTQPVAGVEHPGRTAEVTLDRSGGTGTGDPSTAGGATVAIGRIAELDPRYLRACSSRSERVVVALLDVPMLISDSTGRARRQPAGAVRVERDIAAVVPEAMSAGELDAVIRRAAGSALADLMLFDRYQGPPLGDEEISLAFRLSLYVEEADDPEARAEEIVRSVTRTLIEETGARIRGLEAGNG